jgi:hypothetical protein
VYASSGKKDQAQKLLSKLEAICKEAHIGPYLIARLHFQLQENDTGFEWLEKASSGHGRHIYVMASNSNLECIRSDP